MVLCETCKFCEIFEMNSGRRHYICEYGGNRFSAYGNFEEVSCPHFKLRPSPPKAQVVSEEDVWKILLPPFPPFAHTKTKREG